MIRCHNNTERLFLLGRPFSSLYGSIMRLRRQLYTKGIFKIQKLPCHVISIGNLTLGGTGKTPHVIAITSRLYNLGYKPCVLTRGYGGRAGKGPLVVSNGKEVMAGPDASGDEAYMMAAKLSGVPVIAGSDRYTCGIYAVKKLNASIIVLDDGFQHIRLHRDLDLVLMDATNPLGSGRIFPGGTLREHPSALGRADAGIITKCNEVPLNTLELIEEDLRPFIKDRPLFKSHYELDSFEWAYNEITEDQKDIFTSSCFSFCGLANPSSFINILNAKGVNLAGSIYYPDHHFYTERDIKRIGQQAKSHNCTIVLTTEKDFAKISPHRWKSVNSDLALAVVKIKVNLSESFWHFLQCQLKDIPL